MTVQLELVPLRGNENETNETGSWYLFGVLFKISYKQPLLFICDPHSPSATGSVYLQKARNRPAVFENFVATKTCLSRCISPIKVKNVYSKLPNSYSYPKYMALGNLF